jgi:hypothetical protein
MKSQTAHQAGSKRGHLTHKEANKRGRFVCISFRANSSTEPFDSLTYSQHRKYPLFISTRYSEPMLAALQCSSGLPYICTDMMNKNSHLALPMQHYHSASFDTTRPPLKLTLLLEVCPALDAGVPVASISATSS